MPRTAFVCIVCFLRLVNLCSFGLIASLVNTLSKWPLYTTDQLAISVIYYMRSYQFSTLCAGA